MKIAAKKKSWICANVVMSCERVAKGIFAGVSLENESFEVFGAGGKLETVLKAGERLESESSKS